MMTLIMMMTMIEYCFNSPAASDLASEVTEAKDQGQE